jgi:epoxyqueuosine reductase
MMPSAIAAGLGELGRNGLVITEKYGARISLGNPILTDLPLESDQPIDIAVEDFCKICRKCATACPTT